MQTRGELYQKSEEETQVLDSINFHLREAYNSFKQAKDIASIHNWKYNFEFYWDTDGDGEPVMLSNYETPITISVSVANQWMSSTQDC